MKVFFNASLSGKRTLLSEYELIFDVLKKTEGVTLLESPVFPGSSEKVATETIDEASQYFRKLQGWIRNCDIAVFEASYPSLGIGYETAMALQQDKSVIVLHQPEKKPFVLEAIINDKLQIVEYTENNLRNLLEESIGYALDRQDTRFNFFISPKIGNYLDWMSRKRRLPRAVYLRRLIEEDMRKNKDYEA